MSRLIDADALQHEGYEEIVAMIDAAPTVDAVPVVRGKWERVEYVSGMVYATCYECGYTCARDFENDTISITEKYCKDCGAKMEVEK